MFREFKNSTIAVRFEPEERPVSYEEYRFRLYSEVDGFCDVSGFGCCFGNSYATDVIAHENGHDYHVTWEDFERASTGRWVYLPACDHNPELFAA